MTPEKIRERLAESDRVDPELYVRALRYVRGERLDEGER